MLKEKQLGLMPNVLHVLSDTWQDAFRHFCCASEYIRHFMSSPSYIVLL